MLTFSSSLPFVLPRAHSRAFCQVPRLRLIADAFGALVRHLHPSCACAHPFSALMSSFGFGFVLAGDPSTTFRASQRGTLRSCGPTLLTRSSPRSRRARGSWGSARVGRCTQSRERPDSWIACRRSKTRWSRLLRVRGRE
jgi:hypothetical protein